jgi:hypothetical protein
MIGNRLFEILAVLVSRDSDASLRLRCGYKSEISNHKSAMGRQPSGDYSAVAPPVPIPNTAVKRCSPDGSTAIGRARVGRRQNKNPAGFNLSGVFAFVATPTRAENTTCWEAVG